jgi:hypothetical protein
VLDQVGTAKQLVKLTRSQLRLAGIDRLKENKPIVLTESDHDGAHPRYRLCNIGNAPAVNVWYQEEGGEPIALGAVPRGESRPVPPVMAETLSRAGERRHLLIAESRPLTGRPWTVTLNIIPAADDEAPFHAFTDLFQVDRAGPIREFLRHEGDVLLERLRGLRPGE